MFWNWRASACIHQTMGERKQQETRTRLCLGKFLPCNPLSYTRLQSILLSLFRVVFFLRCSSGNIPAKVHEYTPSTADSSNGLKRQFTLDPESCNEDYDSSPCLETCVRTTIDFELASRPLLALPKTLINR